MNLNYQKEGISLHHESKKYIANPYNQKVKNCTLTQRKVTDLQYPFMIQVYK